MQKCRFWNFRNPMQEKEPIDLSSRFPQKVKVISTPKLGEEVNPVVQENYGLTCEDESKTIGFFGLFRL